MVVGPRFNPPGYNRWRWRRTGRCASGTSGQATEVAYLPARVTCQPPHAVARSSISTCGFRQSEDLREPVAPARRAPAKTRGMRRASSYAMATDHPQPRLRAALLGGTRRTCTARSPTHRDEAMAGPLHDAAAPAGAHARSTAAADREMIFVVDCSGSMRRRAARRRAKRSIRQLSFDRLGPERHLLRSSGSATSATAMRSQPRSRRRLANLRRARRYVDNARGRRRHDDDQRYPRRARGAAGRRSGAAS